jgi:hypothetical protein
MYPRIPWEQVADPLGSAEHTLRTTYLDDSQFLAMSIEALLE